MSRDVEPLVRSQHVRLPDWEDRLQAFLASVIDEPYRLGRHDCLLFCLGAADAQTGSSMLDAHRGRYRTDVGAARRLQMFGCSTPDDAIDMSFERKPVGFAQRGDIVLCDVGGKAIPGVSLADRALIVGSNDEREGLFSVGRESWLKAWAV